jgi:hypothetical protein
MSTFSADATSLGLPVKNPAIRPPAGICRNAP